MGEHQLHQELARLSGSRACLGWDACPGPGGLLYSIDGYAEPESRLPWMTLEDWGYRALVHAVSDIIASGGKPLAAWYSVGVRGELEALSVARGVGDAAEVLGIPVLKSDYNTADIQWIDVATVGIPARARAVSRRGGAPGDILYQVGFLGYGLAERLALEGRVDPGLASRWTRRVPVLAAAGPVSGYASASIDNSDGWSRTLWELSRYSRVILDVRRVVGDPAVLDALEKSVGSRPGPWELFTSWEDFNLAVLVPRGRAGLFEESCRDAGIECFRVGEARGRGVGVYYRGKLVEEAGWSWTRS